MSGMGRRAKRGSRKKIFTGKHFRLRLKAKKSKGKQESEWNHEDHENKLREKMFGREK